MANLIIEKMIIRSIRISGYFFFVMVNTKITIAHYYHLKYEYFFIVLLREESHDFLSELLVITTKSSIVIYYFYEIISILLQFILNLKIYMR